MSAIIDRCLHQLKVNHRQSHILSQKPSFDTLNKAEVAWVLTLPILFMRDLMRDEQLYCIIFCVTINKLTFFVRSSFALTHFNFQVIGIIIRKEVLKKKCHHSCHHWWGRRLQKWANKSSLQKIQIKFIQRIQLYFSRFIWFKPL